MSRLGNRILVVAGVAGIGGGLGDTITVYLEQDSEEIRAAVLEVIENKEAIVKFVYTGVIRAE